MRMIEETDEFRFFVNGISQSKTSPHCWIKKGCCQLCAKNMEFCYNHDKGGSCDYHKCKDFIICDGESELDIKLFKEEQHRIEKEQEDRFKEEYLRRQRFDEAHKKENE